MPTRTAAFTDAGGIRIIYDVHTAFGVPEGQRPRGIVQLLHGIGEHAARYGELISILTAAGFTVYADDHRGHGRTGMQQHKGDAAKLGRPGRGGLRAAKDAVWQFTELIRAENPGVPLVILGHSWGSFLAQMLVNEHPEAYDGLVLTGSGLRTPFTLNTGNLNKPWDGPGANGSEWQSSDPAVQQAFLDDPLTTGETFQKLYGWIDSLRLSGRPRKGLAEERGSGIPTLLMVGRDDTLGGPRSVHLLADAYRTRSGFTDVTTLVYPDARHEIFNEVMRADVFADLVAWLDLRFQPRT
ncbi:lysophospholipase [Microbacterium mangrovi]|uniref:Lysophospholipase n=1 Tax=Microbacterium mangrovi TaxID=1348253 RepID=A0A0B2A1K1_9MICO|nr:alpha/beta fold hydrolase [Microbacterium mangrovi]KHK95674.1 lysophospholipase [Microbacterium mangrovi]